MASRIHHQQCQWEDSRKALEDDKEIADHHWYLSETRDTCLVSADSEFVPLLQPETTENRSRLALSKHKFINW